MIPQMTTPTPLRPGAIRPAGIATDAYARLGPAPFLDPYARLRRARRVPQ